MSARDEYFAMLEEGYGLPDGWRGQWEPGADLRPGQLGAIDGDNFRVTGSLKDDADIHVATKEEPGGDEVTYAQEGSLEVFAKAKGETDALFKHIAQASAGAKLKFTEANARAMILRGLTEHRVTSERRLATDMVNALHEGRLRYGDVVVTHVKRAAFGLLLLGSEAGAEVEVSTNVDIGKGKITLGKVKGSIGIEYQSKMSFAQQMNDGFALMYRAVKIRKKGLIFVRPDVGPAAVPEEDDVFVSFDGLGAPDEAGAPV